MDAPPLTLDHPPHALHPLPDLPTPPRFRCPPLSTTALPSPAPPEGFTLSPTHNYPAPFGAMSLGSTLGVGVKLFNRLQGAL
ncbi:hypothetical protein EHS25_006216 [Saitozyma podzolica]|uniref:Uncharacterized protein n=1 Tax=Saitozyma podzolica TaxID=1890683 RepID=A0A427XRX8_9TREE|nr:hypothetical protein EHS25_006216 [Saitozyma podzolica]